MEEDEGIERGFKVISRNNRTSIMVRKEGRVTYNINKWATPKKGNGPLCVFNNKGNARDFSCQIGYHGLKVVPCQYEKAKEETVWYKYLLSKSGPLSRKKSHFPPGTVLASKVMCLE